jgi:hypothetical protein
MNLLNLKLGEQIHLNDQKLFVEQLSDGPDFCVVTLRHANSRRLFRMTDTRLLDLYLQKRIRRASTVTINPSWQSRRVGILVRPQGVDRRHHGRAPRSFQASTHMGGTR